MADDPLVRDPDELEAERARARAAAAAAARGGRPVAYAGADYTGRPSLTRGVNLEDQPEIAPPPQPDTLPNIRGTAGPTRPTSTLADRYRAREETLVGELNPPPATTRLGKFGRVMGTIGQDIGNAVVPEAMANIPHTTLNRRMELAEVRRALGEEQAREATASTEQERTAIEKEKADTAARLAGRPKLLTGEQDVYTPPGGGPRLRAWEDQSEPDPTKRIKWYSEGVPEEQQGAAPQVGAPAGTLQGTSQAAPAAATPEQQTLPSTGGAVSRGTPGAIQPVGAMPTVAPAQKGAPPAGGFFGKPEKKTEEQDFIGKYLKDNKLPDTEENRRVARDEYKRGGPIGDVRAAQAQEQIKTVLKNTGIDPAGYKVSKDSRTDDVKEALTAAQKAASEYRAANAPAAAQARKDAHTMGYALDQKGALIYTNRADADRRGVTFEEMKPDAVNKDRGLLRQLNDIQKNISAYTQAMQTFAATPVEHAAAMRRIEAGINPSDTEKMGYLTMGAAMNMIEAGEVADSWAELDKNERHAMIGYLRAKGAMIAYNRVVSGSAKSNKEALEVEWNNLPHPYVTADVANDQMQAMQENLDQVNGGYPTNLPGMKVPEQVAKETAAKGGGAGAPPAGARIRTWNPATGKLE